MSVLPGPSLAEAYNRALACDPVSAYGSVLAFNRASSVIMSAT